MAQFGRLPVMNGDPSRGLFETVLVVDGRARRWPAHDARLRASALELYGRDPGPLDWSAGAGMALGRLRVDAVPHAGGFTLSARCEPVDPASVLPESEPEVVPVPVSDGFGAHKLIDRTWLAEIESAVGDGARALLVGPDGELLETTRANVFVVRGERSRRRRWTGGSCPASCARSCSSERPRPGSRCARAPSAWTGPTRSC